jgi:hypothetical protein
MNPRSSFRPKMAATGSILAGAGIAAAVTACSAFGNGSPQLNDLKNVNPSYPNYAAIYMDVSGFPNIVEECVNGAGFALTTRDAAGAITRVPEWDTFCQKQIGKQATQNGQP